MSTILILISILFLFKLLRDSLFFTWLWQIKEYRIDRMMSYIKDNKNKKGLLFSAALFLFLYFFIIPENYKAIFVVLVLLYFSVAIFQIIKEIKNRILKRPVLTFKIMLIFFLLGAVYFLIALCWFYSSSKMASNLYLLKTSLLLLFVIIVNPLIISSVILAIEPIFYFQKKRIIKRAAEKMRGLKKVKVIGITGSYGKTSTKEFLYSILSQKYKVVKTEGNNNTNIGVAYTVLNKVSDEHDYFICEMGAYKIGEIKEMCDIVKPSIGILTGINQQHIDLFGSRENIVKGKFELIEALPEEGLAVLNEKLKTKNEKFKLKVKNLKYFSLDKIKNIKVYQDYAEFEYKNKKLKLNLLGKHYIENVLSGIMVAEHLGMTLEEIKNAAEKIRPNEFMMRKLEDLNNSIFIDDSYSANFDGVLAALDYLDEAYSNYRKIIIFPGIIELGKERDKIHKILYDRISEVCDIAYILETGNWKLETGNSLNAKRLHSLEAGTMEPAKECEFVFEKDFCKVEEMLKKDLMSPLTSNPPTPLIRGANIVVLFESRGAGAVMRKLKK